MVHGRGSVIAIVDDAVAAAALVAAGEVVERHYVRMALDLTRPPDAVRLPEGFIVTPAGAEHLAAYGRVVAAAYAGDHVDHQPEDDDPVLAAQLVAGYLAGDDPGPWIAAASVHAIAPDGSVGAVLITSEYSPDGDAQPWITDLAVDPRWAGRGVGAALIGASVARLTERGDHALGLAVTVGNPARRLYERMGFSVTHEVWRFAAG